MKFLVTGGAGFIGSHLVQALLLQGHKVITLDDLSTGREAFLQEVLAHDNHTFIQDSVQNRRVIKQCIDRVDAVFHLAAILGVKNTLEDPVKVIEGNIDGTRHVLELAFRRGIKVVFASTSEIYGKNASLPFSETSDRVYGAPSIHRWCYATAKSIDEHLCFAFADKGLPVTVLRYFNAYGPRQTNSQYGMVIPRFIHAALREEPLLVYGNGSQSRCFTYVDDMVRGTINALGHKANGLAFNIGSNRPITVLQLARMIVRMTDSDSMLQFMSYDEAYGKGYEDMPARIPDLTRSGAVLGFTSLVSLEEGLERTIRWSQGHGGA
ncbi:NAD-dependent epimerase/dehydratase family protein [Paenibacillus albus]|uniref:NAD-dependent epimerase/dehydratase family protein n=1 Tax=Paenibacillus albus TaxID=2495582 RepID=A0A3S9A3N3_9BACL|nr:NAD-dependent epimerase/dehydratase family protein [Paenibacillus albus]AZN40337.1 NAD-dependent epimerase/dehydratase family protein [Paenibacillus albus]